ncbi:response regulator [Sediminibacterium ginsengisoli]|uniref:DNA-binding response regulator, NarL/FixJ family, contains REC and HTH domains n=1 Tax=Sediminibacterium ginsengisoli TaxID=413434 RepID=A0A1T4LBZ2_9BACT|nr:response regulator [Sediminibacterium ginsengisoli]SJZ52024.1 DNA-binding response regulator, NarL/FixJ family, contains REC and HTH domains [Sediminibacterium ginsengisoli]
MIKKVLIAEDQESANISVQKTLEEFGIADPHYVHYCDDAFHKIKKAKEMGDSYDLLITDLSFEEDERVQKIPDGKALILAVREIQPELKILVFSATREATIIEKLYSKLDIDGYVQKARNDAKELKLAIDTIGKNKCYYPRHLLDLVKQMNSHDFTEYDITIITLLAEGIMQKDIPAHLLEKQISPSGLSSVEKRLSRIKETLGFSKNEQLIAFCKDMGFI